MDHLFQNPPQWNGSHYSTPRSILDELYVVGGASLSQVWRYDRELDSSVGGLNTRIGVGVNLAPIHAVELGFSSMDINQDERHYSLDASYLFNLSAYGECTEDVLPFEILLRGGLEYSFADYSSAHIIGGLRLRYNITPSIGVFLEPSIGACLYSGNNSYYQRGDVTSSAMLGVSVHIGNIISSTSRMMNINSSYWRDYNLSDRKTLLAIKSNMLYDISLIPNIEVEVPIFDKWSIGAQAMCGWWLKSDNSRCWQIQAADIEGRYWFGDRSKHRALTGWFAGVFASAGFYDFQLEDTNGIQGEFYVMTGVSGGYAIPIGRRMNLEFTGGIGYLVNDYQKYTVHASEYLVADGPQMRFKSVFPAKLEVSLGWLLFRGGECRSESRRTYRINREGEMR